jgi:DNA-binding transcriptional ArsR family regulator
MHIDPLSQTLNALADPTRRAILARLSTGSLNVNELAEPFDMSLPAVSKHIKVLEKAGLVTRSKDRQARPVSLSPEPLKEVDEFLKSYRKMWDDRLDRLEQYLHMLQMREKSAK